MAGLTNSKGAGNYDGWLIRLDGAGEVLWQRVYGTNKDDRFAAVLETPDGYVVSAYSSGLGAGGADAWVMNLNTNGAMSESCVENEPWFVQPSDTGYLFVDTTLWVTASSAQSGDTDIAPGYPDYPEDLCQSTCEITCEGQADPETGMEPLNVQFTSTVSSVGCDGETSVEWDFGDGSPGSSEENPTHEYTQQGIYTWTLTVDVGGFLCTDTGTVEVEERRCVVTCSPTGDPVQGFHPLQVGFIADVTATNCIEAVTFDWDFGDGTAGSQLENPDHTYQQAGIYTWTFAASADGETCTGTGTVTVEDPPCTVTCQAEAVPITGQAPLEIQFTATFTADNCIGDPVFTWDFGDGAASAEQNPAHSYDEGTHNWSFTVVVDGVSCTATGTVAVGRIPGDCDGSGSVTIGEVQKAINMFLGVEPVSCGVDCNGDGSVSIGEVQKVVNAFLGLPTTC